MKNKKIGLFIVVFAMFLFITGCGIKSQVLGTWSHSYYGSWISMDSDYTFFSNNKVELYVKVNSSPGKTYEGTYKISGNKITAYIEDNVHDFVYDKKNDVLWSLDDDGARADKYER